MSGASYKLAFASEDNPSENKLRKIKKSLQFSKYSKYKFQNLYKLFLHDCNLNL